MEEFHYVDMLYAWLNFIAENSWHLQMEGID